MSDGELPPLVMLLSAHAGAQADRHRAIWAFDGRLATIARTTSEAMIGQMRLAWWNDVIDDPHGVKGQGEPVIEQMRAAGVMAAPGLTAMIDGWEVLVVEPEIDGQGLRDYAAGRGGGLFRALADAPDAPDWLDEAGQVWALWDLSGHVGDDALADAALGQARAVLETMPLIRWPGAWKPLRLAYGLARQDVLAGRRAPVGVSRGMALRLLRLALFGR
ncbi:hypothetical protein [Sphingobium sp. KCTC 72723]|uniref:hypothetical protein n=1 Tax=Sphingobium sp. KCTC 72723 TaxID=2733867 RepID=UPI00165E2C10|nr:hypothetical protein [Sphingobium sp. KCTC 72723]